MNRKLLAGFVTLVVAVAVVWLLWLRNRGEKPEQPSSDPTRSAAIAPKPTTTSEHAESAQAPRGVAPRWRLDLDPDGPIQLEGQVLGPDGHGVGGAQVWISSVPPRTTKAEDDGTFSFAKLVGRTYALTASSGKLVGATNYKLVDKGDPVVIRLTEGAAIEVSVVDDDKRPIKDAEVKEGGISEHGMKTDDAGKVRLEPVHPGYVSVEANASGHAPGSGFTTVGSGGSVGHLTLTLHKGFAVSGKVVDETGKPIAKAHVTAGEGMWGLGDDTNEADTDDKGAFKFAALAAGTHSLTATDGEHAPAVAVAVQVSDHAVSGIEIKMKKGASIAGTVVDTAGKPVAFATIRVGGTGQQRWQVAARQTTSDRNGKFEVRGLARAKLQARAESDTAASKVVAVDLVTLEAKRDLELVLDVSGTIAGIVVDDAGAPVAEVQVNAFPDFSSGAAADSLSLAGLSSATSDGGGGFTIHGLPDGAYKLWAARPNGGEPEWGQHGTTARTGDKNVRIALPAVGGLTGKVALEGAASPPKLISVQVGQRPPTPASDGVFQIKEVPAGSYDVTFRSPEFAAFTRRDVKIEPAKTTDLGTITVQRGRKLVGKVVDNAGRPIGGAKIKVGEMLMSSQANEDRMEGFEEMSGVRSSVSEQDGSFMVIGIPKVSTMAMADDSERGRSIAASIPGGTDDPPPVTLTLLGFGSVVGKVTMKGEPQAGVTISESSKGGGAQASFAQTDAEGNYSMAKVPEGPHVLQAMQQKMMAMKSTSITVTVVAGKQTTGNIDIPVGQITLAVQIKALPNNKVDAAQVFLFSGAVVVGNAKQLTDGFFQGGAQGMKFWMGEGKPLPEFDELVPGDYSVCSLPITGDVFGDEKFRQRLQENMQTLKVYCKPIKLTAAPAKQTVIQELPAMTPLPDPGK